MYGHILYIFILLHSSLYLTPSLSTILTNVTNIGEVHCYALQCRQIYVSSNVAVSITN